MIINLKDRIENTHYCISCDGYRVFIPRDMKEHWVSEVVLDIVLGGCVLFALDKILKYFIQCIPIIGMKIL